MRTPWRREHCLTHVAGTAALLSSMACTNGGPAATRSALERPAEPQAADARARERGLMVQHQLAARGIHDARVLAAMRRVPRHEFVPDAWRGEAYADHPLEIGHEQTISQPYIVARMSELARVGPDDKVLEIGTGSGYQAAVLAELARAVYSVEIVEPLARRAAETLARLGHRNVEVRAGDGYRGWPEQAPFDAILVTAAPARVPEPLKQQLAQGGRLVIPVGAGDQELLLLTRRGDQFETERVLAVRFVPMTGAAERQ